MTFAVNLLFKIEETITLPCRTKNIVFHSSIWRRVLKLYLDGPYTRLIKIYIAHLIKKKSISTLKEGRGTCRNGFSNLLPLPLLFSGCKHNCLLRCPVSPQLTVYSRDIFLYYCIRPGSGLTFQYTCILCIMIVHLVALRFIFQLFELFVRLISFRSMFEL